MRQKRGFLLLSVIILMVTFSYLSISIIQNQTFSSQIDKLKYLEIQAKIHMGKIEKYINETNNELEILNYKLEDERFDCQIKSEQLDTNSSQITYHIMVKSKDEPVTLYKNIIKKFLQPS
ncbi:MAG: hypothetical protein L0Y61_03170 [Epsilonproteobacteria bacterium]|nr:hypothetical protein [Campylobacterota bacterium]